MLEDSIIDRHGPSSPSICIEISIEDARWTSWKSQDQLKLCAHLLFDQAFQILNLNHLNVEVSLLLTDDVQIQTLNHQYRHQNKATNVLSFNQFKTLNSICCAASQTDLPLLLGDIVLSIDTIEREAIQQNKKFEDHVCHLLVHGFLHLLGYDHQNEAQAAIMENLEILILKKRHINNPYIKDGSNDQKNLT